MTAGASGVSRWVVKLGGSLLRSPDWPDRFRVWRQAVDLPAADLIIGGGVHVDAIRVRSAAEGWDESRSHWQAIEMMDQNAIEVASVLGLPMQQVGFGTERDRGEEVERGEQGWQVVLLGATLRQLDPLPHGWDVTSDSIAAWWAGERGAAGLVLLKSRDASPGWDPRHDDDRGLVDPRFREFLPKGLPVIVVSRWQTTESANLRASQHRV